MKNVFYTLILVLILILAKKSIMKIIFSVILSVLVSSASAQSWKELKSAATKAKEVITTKELSKSEIASGLKEALEVGASNSSELASEKGGFNNTNLIRIPFPAEAEEMKLTLIKVGLKLQVKQFEESLNSAAEEASKFAKEIFITAVKNMTITDALKILKGEDNAATIYLKKQTSKELYKKFKPIVKKAIEKVHVTKYWNQLSLRYNALPMTNKVNTDIQDYVSNKTIDGLFILIAKEEKNIRNNPDARTSELLQRVFK